jgi:ComF family protein
MSVTRIADGLLSVLVASACAACGDSLSHPSGGPVCDGCWNAVKGFAPPLCNQCGDPLKSWRVLDDTGRCARCRYRSSPLTASRAIGAYEGTLRAIVHAFKYEGCRSLSVRLGAQLRESAADLLGAADAVVPVPLHRSRRRRRGYNQASELARRLGVPMVDALRRVRATPSQTDLPAEARLDNVRNAFAPRRWLAAPALAGLRVVIVDDVSTTGATIEACARVLRTAGAADVSAVTAARVVSRPSE